MVSQIKVEVKGLDSVYGTFSNQLSALGAGKARVAMARAVNHAGNKAYTRVIQALLKQTSAPRAVVRAAVKKRHAAHKGDGAIEFVIYSRGSELPLRMFAPKQFTFGVRAKVWGRMQRFESAFINAGRWNSGNAIAGGHVFVRTGGFNPASGRNNAIEKMYGPSIPKELALGETAETFQQVSRAEVEKRLRHELGRMLG